MADTRKVRVPLAEKIRFINECRKSGMTDIDWWHENDIAVITFYNWISRCREVAPEANYGHLEVPRSKQDVVPIDVVPDHLPKQHKASSMQIPYSDNSHMIQNVMKDITACISVHGKSWVLAQILTAVLGDQVYRSLVFDLLWQIFGHRSNQGSNFPKSCNPYHPDGLSKLSWHGSDDGTDSGDSPLLFPLCYRWTRWISHYRYID